MFIVIDTTNSTIIQLACKFSDDQVYTKIIPVQRNQQEVLLTQVQHLCVGAGGSIAEIAGVGVVTGPGSFSSLRIGVIAGQGLAYALGVPCVGLQRTKDDESIEQLCIALIELASQQKILTPMELIYTQPPSIG